MSNSGGYCWHPSTSESGNDPLGISRLIVNFMALAGSNTTKSVNLSSSIPPVPGSVASAVRC